MPHVVSGSQELFERFEREQHDLDALCAPWSTRPREVWESNADYGSALVLKRYARLPERTPVCAVIPHGVYFDRNAMSPAERDSHLPAVLVFPEYREAAYRNETDLAIIPAASPFVYADRITHYDGPREGTLFFLAHSSPVIRVETDWEALADRLLEWPEHMGPVSVMVYFQDYLLGHHKPFAERGLRIVSAGNAADSDFLQRQAYLIRKHRYAASNGVGSYAFYCIHAGCPFHIIKTGYSYAIPDTEAFAATTTASTAAAWTSTPFGAELAEHFSERSEVITAEQQNLADYYLGTAHALSSDEIAEMLRWLIRFDRFGPLVLRSSVARKLGVDGSSVRNWVPCVIRRPLAFAGKVMSMFVSDPKRVLRRVFRSR